MNKYLDKFCMVQHVGPPSEGRVNITGTLTDVDVYAHPSGEAVATLNPDFALKLCALLEAADKYVGTEEFKYLFQLEEALKALEDHK